MTSYGRVHPRRDRQVAKLLIHHEGGAPVTFPLVLPEVLIGRLNSADLILDDPAVSRIHAKIVREAEGDVLVDLESSTGTCVNGEMIHRHALADGDVIEMGSARLEYRE